MNVRYLIIISVLIMLMLALSIVFFIILYQRRMIIHQQTIKAINDRKQLELMQASINGEEEERQRISAELHDDVGALLSSIRLFLTQAARKAEDPSLINQIRELLDESIRKVRDISHQLQPGMLQYLGLARALQSFADMINRSGGIRIEIDADSGAWTDPDAQTALSGYRIIQELVNNIIKHADAAWIRISLGAGAEGGIVSITHNGSGLTEAAYREQLFKRGAIGLKNIENRLKSSGISIAFPAAEDDIYAVTLNFPLPAHL